MKKYNKNELKQLGTSPNALIAQKLGCSHMTVVDALKNGKGGKRKTALYISICHAADSFLKTNKSIQLID